MKSAVQARSTLAASAAEVIPFSCIVCFEEFNTTTRPPMILPCGHTYVCQQCTKRLRRCMECRQSLFMTPPNQHHPHEHYNNNNLHPPHLAVGSSRTSRFAPSPSTPSKGHQQNSNAIPLPIPKNLVLLAMMEAAERQGFQSVKNENDRARKELEENENKTTSTSSPSSMIDYDDDDDEGESSSDEEEEDEEEEVFDLDKIITGMATLVGPCGTYAVRDREGLIVLPHDPRKKTIDGSVLKESAAANTSATTPNRSKLFVVEDLDTKTTTATPSVASDAMRSPRAVFIDETKEDTPLPPESEIDSPSSQQAHTGSSFVLRSSASLDFDEDTVNTPSNSNRERKDAEPAVVQFGQKLQVVSFREGVAQLARNQGYICATHSQLAKVGGPVDDSCRLEGLLDTIQGRGKDLQATLDENHKIEVGLLEYIRSAQEQEPSYPVISEPPTPPLEDLALGRSKSADHDCIPSDRTPTTPPASALLQPSLQTPDTGGYPGNSLGHPPLSAESTGGGYIRPSVTCPAMPSSPNSIDNSDLSVAARLSSGREGGEGLTTSASTDNTANSAALALIGCGVLPPELLGDGDGSADSNEDTSANMLLRGLASAMDGSPDQAARSSTMNFNHRSPPPAASMSSSFDSGHVNFRTGMSGHGGLSSSKRNYKNSPTPQYHHPNSHHNHYNQTSHQPHRSSGRSRGRLWQMGEHRGLSTPGNNSQQARAARPTYYHP